MNYYKASQRAENGNFDFTCQNDNIIYPVGYCKPYTEWWVNSQFPINPKQIEEYKATKDKHHSVGHATADEAVECYKQYTLDHKLRLNLKYDSQQEKCKVCEEWTQLYAEVGGSRITSLCEQHNNREEVEKLYIASSQIISSW